MQKCKFKVALLLWEATCKNMGVKPSADRKPTLYIILRGSPCADFSNRVSLITRLLRLKLLPREKEMLGPCSIFPLLSFPQASDAVSDGKREDLDITQLPQVQLQLRGQIQVPACGKGCTTQSLLLPLAAVTPHVLQSAAFPCVAGKEGRQPVG